MTYHGTRRRSYLRSWRESLYYRCTQPSLHPHMLMDHEWTTRRPAPHSQPCMLSPSLALLALPSLWLAGRSSALRLYPVSVRLRPPVGRRRGAVAADHATMATNDRKRLRHYVSASWRLIYRLDQSTNGLEAAGLHHGEAARGLEGAEEAELALAAEAARLHHGEAARGPPPSRR